MINNTNEIQIKSVHTKLYAGVKQEEPNNLTKNKILNPIPISKVVIIIALTFISIILVRNVSVPDIKIVMILINSNEIRIVVNIM